MADIVIAGGFVDTDRIARAVAASNVRAGIIEGCAQEVLPRLSSELAQACVTSPPYYFLRDYGHERQIGHEPTLDEYLAALLSVFSEVRRVLRCDGVLWLNIGDGWTSGGRSWRAPDAKNRQRAMSRRPPTPWGLKPKDLLLVPARLASALQQPVLGCRRCGHAEHALSWGSLPQNRGRICPGCLEADTAEIAEKGWYLRSEVIWERGNCQPESVKDRVTRSHEQIWMLTKSERYFYDNRAVRGPNGRNLRSVWQINGASGRGRVASYPEALVERCLLLSSREGDVVLDPFLGSGTTAAAAVTLKRRSLGIELDGLSAKRAAARVRQAC
ncbi:MAG: site-specific DNA-methyltransferase [Gemmatimonadetes bacterium]|nr:site-specific DNA-methyltransferase [Gemmatimonadota bacterium]